MAAISATRTHTTTATTTSTLTPPSSSQEEDRSWGEYSTKPRLEVRDKKNSYAVEDATNGGHSSTSHHGTTDDYTPHMTNGDFEVRKPATNGSVYSGQSGHRAQDSLNRTSPPYGSGAEPAKMNGAAHFDAHTDRPPARRTVSSSATDRRKVGEAEGPDDDSKWIHRDKLALIESQELQAAGIILPRQRMPSRARRAHDAAGPARASDASLTDRPGMSRSRANSFADQRPTDIEIPAWDLRLPDEIIAEASKGFMTPTGLAKGATRIPVAKLSPAPIPLDYLERDSPSARKLSSSDDLGKNGDSISYPKPRSRSASVKLDNITPPGTAVPVKRSATDVSPKKAASGPGRRPSGRAASTGRPKTRSGPNKDSTSSAGTRPSTRSGDLTSTSKQPERDPPWLVSAYQPDPRLPPDQQLLPTVARRLQQERWEKEGKFGNVYDKEFRPLTDDGFLQPPEKREPEPQPDEPEPEQQQPNEWPLKGDAGRSQTPKLGINSYSTMPKISDKPPQLSPLPSPRTPGMPPQHQPLSPQSVSRMSHQQQQQPQEQTKQKEGGCGCCIVM
ncbi:hypothetical protein jhhlp_001834 [Lomentospora prolificans]|uniref:TeaA receptor TeaR n=1 Tax=Lomentospora prolificans TaxID=41688 RepID=A0A2N3NH57_9PEZI|nr:hypothetical protein jhhlp_001834 [Lomentospora prolificans]